MKTFLVIADPGTCSRMEQHIFVVKAANATSAYKKFWKKCINDVNTSKIFDDVFIYNDPLDDSPPLSMNDFDVVHKSDNGLVTIYDTHQFDTTSIKVVELDKCTDECTLVMKNKYNL